MVIIVGRIHSTHMLPRSLVGFALLIAFTIVPSSVRASASSDSSIYDRSGAIRADVVIPPPARPHISRNDLYFLGATATGITLAMFHDEWLTERAVENQDDDLRESTADIFNALPYAAVGSAAVLYAYGRWGGHPTLARRAGRAGISTLTAAGVTSVIKLTAGRVRPRDEPDDPFTFDPFSGHGSFPSGHTTIAFAAAVALDRETTSGWVPWVVYPTAAMVGWARVQDLDHWASDVVAGAAIGGWVSWKMESLMAGRAIGVPDPGRTSLLLMPRDGTLQLVVTRQF
jgi:membrane-associated phospholipid phosphatase